MIFFCHCKCLIFALFFSTALSQGIQKNLLENSCNHLSSFSALLERKKKLLFLNSFLLPLGGASPSVLICWFLLLSHWDQSLLQLQNIPSISHELWNGCLCMFQNNTASNKMQNNKCLHLNHCKSCYFLKELHIANSFDSLKIK